MTDNQEPEKHFNKYASRKFIVCGVVFFGATVFLLTDTISGDNWTNIALACVAGYNLANAYSAGRR